MPHKPVNKLKLQLPAWVSDISDVCARETVVEALVMRDTAIGRGALNHPACNRVLKKADTTLHAVADGRTEDCKKIASALRKYNTAAECAHPTAQRSKSLGRAR